MYVCVCECVCVCVCVCLSVCMIRTARGLAGILRTIVRAREELLPPACEVGSS